MYASLPFKLLFCCTCTVILAECFRQAGNNRRVLVEHPQHQSGALMHQHIVQPPLSLGQYQDVQHLIPQTVPSYQLHQLHQVGCQSRHSST